MVLAVEELPVDDAVDVPLVELTDLRAHEDELLAGVCEHIGQKRPQSRQTVAAVAGHFAEDRALAV